MLVLDTAGGRILSIARGAAEMKVAIALKASAPSSIAASEEEGVVYVTHADGISRVDLGSQTMSTVSSSRGFDLTRFERLRIHRGALLGLQASSEGLLQVVRLELSSNGRTITDAAVINVATDAVDAAVVPASTPDGPAGRRPFLTISGDGDVLPRGAGGILIRQPRRDPPRPSALTVADAIRHTVIPDEDSKVPCGCSAAGFALDFQFWRSRSRPPR